MTKRTWFITGASAGLGRALAEAALARGERVAATAPAVGMLEELRARYGEQVLALPLDVTLRQSAVAAVQRALDVFGRLDVVLDNAGYGIALLEEAREDAALRARVEDNFFASLWVTHAALPHLRAQRSGHLLAVARESRAARPRDGHASLHRPRA